MYTYVHIGSGSAVSTHWQNIMAKLKKKPDPPTPPVNPRLTCLPLADLGWDGFEEFCCDMISRLPAVRDCHRYGTQGDTQLGIDIFADFENGERWAFQNRRWKQFGPRAVEKAVDATTYAADRFIILLSRVATAKTRKEIGKHDIWDIWDARDISRRVRELPLDDARRLLDHHFGAAVRRAFLGVSAASTFATAEAFFRPLLDASKLFNHTWALVGRQDHLRGLHEFIDTEKKKVGIVVGRGGIGKTKLLHAFSQDFGSRHPNFTLRILVEGLSVTHESFDDLPMAPCVVVVDDAYRRGDDIAALLALVQQRTNPLKVILSARSQGVDHLNSLLSRAGIDEREVVRIVTISDLSRDETKNLARQALGNGHAHFADRLAAATRDCPLVTVVGGQLLAQSAVDPRMLDQHDEFRQVVLTRFKDIVIGQVGDRIEPALCERLLKLMAAVAPFRPDSEQFQKAAAAFLGVDMAVFTDAVGVLEKHGILLRRGYSLRIVPDVLADHVLHNACLTSQGQTTGYAQQVYQHFAPSCLTQVLGNLAELDWRIQHTTGEQTDLLAAIWHNIEEGFRAAPHSVRLEMLDVLKGIAYYQPARMLALVQYAMRNPATVPEDEQVSRFHQFTHEDVVRRLPEHLKWISRTLDYLPCCADLLWELGRDDGRKTSFGPEHPMTTLRDLASYHLDKPFAFNQEILEAVRRWLRDPEAHGHLHSPLEILDPLFAKTGHTSYSEGHQIAIRAFKLSREEIETLRSDALNLVRYCALSGNIKVALRALSSFENALRAPMPLFGMEISREEHVQWVPEQLMILGFLRDLAQQTTHCLVHLRIREVLCWHSRYGALAVKQQAQEIIAAIPDSFDLRLTRLLIQSRDIHGFPEDGEEPTVALQRNHQRLADFRRSVANEYWQQHSDASECFKDLSERLLGFQACDRESHPEFFLHTLVELQPKRAGQLCEAALGEPDSPLAVFFGLFLTHVRHTDVPNAIGLARRAVEQGHVILCRALGDIYDRHITWSSEIQTDDLAILRGLLNHTDVGVKGMAINALRSLGRCHPETAVSLARLVEIGMNAALGDALCAIFHPQYGIPPASLSDDDFSTLLKKLEAIDRLDHHVQEFLAFAAERQPREVIDLLLRRVERGDARYDADFQPIPYLGLDYPLTGLANNGDYELFLKQVRDRALGTERHSRLWLMKLFNEVSFGYSSSCVTVLDEWINSGDPAKIEAAASLLTEAPAGFVFDHFDFVSNALSRAAVAGDECCRSVSGHLYRCAVEHGRERVGGGPFPQDLTLRDKATAAVRRTQAGTQQHQFYDSLVRRAKGNIRDAQAWDEEIEG